MDDIQVRGYNLVFIIWYIFSKSPIKLKIKYGNIQINLDA